MKNMLLALCFSMSAFAQQKNVSVLYIGSNVTDLRETGYASNNQFAQQNLKEFKGFNIGWSAPIDDSPMTTNIEDKNILDENVNKIAESSKIRARIFKGDKEAMNEWASRTDLIEARKKYIYSTGDIGMASLIARYSLNKSKVLSLKIDNDETSDNVKLKNFMSNISPGKSVFSTEINSKELGKLFSNILTMGKTSSVINRLIKASDARVVKSLYVSSTPHFLAFIQELKLEEETKLNRKLTPKEIYNADKIALNSFLSEQKKEWCSPMQNNPQTLFVIPAAYGSSVKEILDGGNQDLYPTYPAACAKYYSNTVVTTVTEENGELASYADYGQIFDLALPKIQSYYVRTGVEDIMGSGTCPANAVVAGVAASLFSSNPRMSPLQVKNEILKLARASEVLNGKVKNSMFLSRDAIKKFDAFPELNF